MPTAANKRKYPDVYVQPVGEAKKFARWGLDARDKAPTSKKGGLDTRESGRQGVGSGVARARDIIAGKRVNAAQVKAFFDRHEGYYKAAMERFEAQDLSLREYASKEPSIQSWWLWGGDPLREQVVEAMAKHKPDKNPSYAQIKRRLMRGG